MTTVSKRVISLLLALVLLGSNMTGIAQTAHAAENEIPETISLEEVPEETQAEEEPEEEASEVTEAEETVTEATETEEVETEEVEVEAEETEGAEVEETETEEAAGEISAEVIIDSAVMAAATLAELDTCVTGLSSTYTEASNAGFAHWTAEKDAVSGAVTITGIVEGSPKAKVYLAENSTLTLKNILDEEAVLTFDYAVELGSDNNSTAAIAGTEVTGTGMYELVMKPDDSLDILLTAVRFQAGTNKITMKLTNVSFGANPDVETTFQVAQNGSYTVAYGDTDPVSITEDTKLTNKATTNYTLTAVPAEGYSFAGWYNVTGGYYFGTGLTTNARFDNPAAVVPLFIKTADAVYGVGDARFIDLDTAATYAENAPDKVINLLQDAALTSGTYTIPAGVTLLVPFDNENTLYTDKPASTSSKNNNVSWEKPVAYRTLTLENGAKLEVAGTISVSAKHAAGGYKTAGSPTGAYGHIDMASGSNITVENGGKLYAWGYITGDGTITAKSGSAVFENLQITDFRGGSASATMVPTGEDDPLLDKKKVFPFSQYYVQNIEVELTLHSGAKESVYTSIYALDDVNSVMIDFIGTETSMFYIAEGSYVVKDYDPQIDRLTISACGNGSVKVNGMSLTLAGVTVSSAMFNLPITNNITININGGSATINQDIALLPGSEVNIAKGAELTVTNEYNIFVYDTTEWTSGSFVYNNLKINPVSYSPSGLGIRAALADAKVDINGALNMEAYLYTTASGANVTSSQGTGMIWLNYGAGDRTYTNQVTQSNTDTTFVDIPITSVKLKNGDGTYVTTDHLGTEAGGYAYKNGEWIDYAVVAYDANGGTGTMDPATVTYTDIFWEENVVKISGNGFEKYRAEFVEWNTSADGKGTSYQPGEEIAVTGDVTLYAIWESLEKEVSITFDANGGEGTMAPQTGNNMDPFTLNANAFTKEGYTFKGWATSKDGEKVYNDKQANIALTANTTLYAVWEINTYTLKWVVGDTTVKTESVVYGDSLTAPEYTAPDGYAFDGWQNVPKTMPAQDLTINGAVSAKKYHVTFKFGEDVVKEYDAEYGAVITLPEVNPTKAETPAENKQHTVYTFKAWAGYTDGMTVPAKDVTFEAEFQGTLNNCTDKTDDGDHTCEICGAENISDHIGGSATCMEPAVCSDCGNSYGQKNPDAHTGKNTTGINAKAATCEEDGYTGDTVCECGTVVTYGKKIEHSGHNYKLTSRKWSEDGKSCTAYATCQNDSKHTTTATATVTGTQSKAPTCITMGDTTYTAVFAETWAKSDAPITKTVTDIEKIPHFDGDDKNHTCDTEGCYAKVTDCEDANNDGNHDCDVCGAANVSGHTGGMATCQDKAVCSECNASYGEKDPDKHTKTTYIYIDNNNDTDHTKKHECCGKVAAANEAHTYDQVTHVCACKAVECFYIHIDANGGVISSSSSDKLYYTFGGVLGDLNWEDIAREGHTFNGWKIYTDADHLTEYTGTTVPGHDLYAVAQWTANPYTITLTAASENVTLSKNAIRHGEDLTVDLTCAEGTGSRVIINSIKIANKAFTGFAFDGKTLTISGKDVTGDVVIDAAAAYALTIDFENAVVSEELKSVLEGQGLVLTEENKVTEIRVSGTDFSTAMYETGLTVEGHSMTAYKINGEEYNLNDTQKQNGDWTITFVWSINSYELNVYTYEVISPAQGTLTWFRTVQDEEVPYGAALAELMPEVVDITVDGKVYSGVWEFAGWTNTDGADGLLETLPATMPAGDLTLREWRTFTGWYTDAKGTQYLVKDEPITNTVYHVGEDAYLFDEEGYIVAGAGLVRHVTAENVVEYYYFCDGEDGSCVLDCAEKSYTAFKSDVHWIEKTNELLPKWEYTFDDRGVIEHHENTGLNGRVLDETTGLTTYYIDGVKAYMGLMQDETGYYYIRSNGVMVVDRAYWITKTNGLLEEKSYNFNADGYIVFEDKKEGIVEEADGLYYYRDGEKYYAGLIEIDGAYYYVRTSGQLVTGRTYWITKTNDLLPEQNYTFGEDGKLLIEDGKDGFVEEDGATYYYSNGIKTYAGLIEVEGAYYYINSKCQMIKDCQYWITKTNGLMEEKSYTFGADGKMVIEVIDTSLNGIVDGVYYVDGVKTYVGLIEIDGAYYYVNSDCKIVTGRKYWITKTNGLMKEGMYTFAEDGKMVL